MTCPECHAENSAGMRFCGHCGAPLLVACPSCQADNPARNKFCGQCGAPLPVRTQSQSASFPSGDDGELKQVTVLFCDVVDSTIITERLGPEAMHELIRWFIVRAAGIGQVKAPLLIK